MCIWCQVKKSNVCNLPPFYTFLCCLQKGHIQAINAVGWYALEKEKNATKAVQYFEQAYNRGSADAAHNLGHIYYSALYPEIGHDRVRHMFVFFSLIICGRYSFIAYSDGTYVGTGLDRYQNGSLYIMSNLHTATDGLFRQNLCGNGKFPRKLQCEGLT